ncbi:MAG: hypothetical protein WD534_08575 [Phycisphaeraceae bacterium]
MSILASQAEHPVWVLYDRYKELRLNVRYFERMLHETMRLNRVMQIVIAVFASTTVAGLWLFSTPIGLVLWRLVSAAAAICAVAHPFLKLDEKTQKYEALMTSYRLLAHEAASLVDRVRTENIYNDEHRLILDGIINKQRRLLELYPVACCNEKLRNQCTDEVNRELPAESFFIPRSAS